ncbi:MAG: sn-glycerol-3-phosphate ABC transporter ATP-binding protein UgpC [Burkholderiaceae bacterium]
MASVTIEQVSKAFGSTRVVHDVDVSIDDGEFCVLVGPSGCGKSTLLRMIAGLEDTTAGRIRIGDRVVNDVQPKDRDVAMVFQNYALYPHMKVRENMAFSLMLARRPKAEIEARVTEAAAILDLTKYLDRYPRQLSGGQRQRVAMGRAIVRQPQVFLFDEPLSNLDAKLRVQMRTEIKALHQRLRTTSIYVTHDQIEAMTMADRIVVMRDGRVAQIGTPLELYDRPANTFVAGFIGSPAMNLLAGTVHGAEVRLADGARVPVPALAAAGIADGLQVRVGIRPEHLMLGDGAIRARIQVVEPTGADTHLICRLGDEGLTVAMRERPSMRAGDVISLRPDPEQIHVFDADSGERLGLSPGPDPGRHASASAA